ncbi:LysM peptidoglycan-binding domain-containing protein [Streptomyces sp. P9-A2]|uniref:LysM peptidoglycan-binding domain-containing protein n=1 Tax=Streptomyces sp. P9-A2 TaxID=3072284 RepID=UPI003FCEA3D6
MQRAPPGNVRRPHQPDPPHHRIPRTTRRRAGGADRSSSGGDHTVREGDTPSAVAARHGTTWQQLYAADEAVIGGDPDVILPGRRLVLWSIPDAPGGEVRRGPVRTVTVREG